MSNYILNKITADKDTIKDIVSKYVTSSTFDFNKIIPAEFDFRPDKWDTQYCGTIEDTTDTAIFFSTRNTPPYGILSELSKTYTDKEIILESHDEDDFGRPMIKTLWLNGCNTKAYAAEFDYDTNDFLAYEEIPSTHPKYSV